MIIILNSEAVKLYIFSGQILLENKEFDYNKKSPDVDLSSFVITFLTELFVLAISHFGLTSFFYCRWLSIGCVPVHILFSLQFTGCLEQNSVFFFFFPYSILLWTCMSATQFSFTVTVLRIIQHWTSECGHFLYMCRCALKNDVYNSSRYSYSAQMSVRKFFFYLTLSIIT